MRETNTTNDKKTIRALDKKWGLAASSNDLDGVVSMYARNGTLVWPDNPPYHGTEAIRAQWTKMFKEYPKLKLVFTPTRIDISEAGDMAVDFGVVDFQFTAPEGVQRQIAKYVVVWRKVRGAWKVLYDSWNGNEPAGDTQSGGSSSKTKKSAASRNA